MDPDMVPDLLCKLGNFYNRASDESRLNVFFTIPEDALSNDETSGFGERKENDIGNILLDKVVLRSSITSPSILSSISVTA